MNIYKTEVCGSRETTISIEIDSEKKTDVEFAKELLKVAVNEPLAIKVDDGNMSPSELNQMIKEIQKMPVSWIKIT